MLKLTEDHEQYTFPARLIAARQQCGLSRADLARQAGIHPVYLWKIENGERRNLGIEHLTRLCRALHMRADVLLGLEYY